MMDETKKESDDKEGSRNRVKKKRGRSSHSKKSPGSGKNKNSEDPEPLDPKPMQQIPEDASRPADNQGALTSGNNEFVPTTSTVEDKLIDLNLDNSIVDPHAPYSVTAFNENNGYGERQTIMISSVEELNHVLFLYSANLGNNLLHYGVTVLKLVECDLKSLPHELGLLTSLEVMNVSQNKIEELPDSIGQLQCLYTLQAEFNCLTCLPTSIKDLKSLSLLVVNDNQLKTLPNGISDLKQLDTLDISGNMLTSLPVVFESARTIRRIYAQKNLLKSLPSWLTQMESIQELHLGENQISDWSDFKTFGKVAASLQILDFCENKLCMLADSFDGLTELSCLNLGRNPFENQKKPWATGNFLTSLPKSFCQLKKVTLLSLDGNQLKSLPSNFGDLVNLRMINLVQNCLETLPDSFCDLPSLELCLLSRNCLQHLPKRFGCLPLLNHLEVSNNKLCELPNTFKDLVKLTYLDLSSNRLAKEPNCLHHLTHLNYLNVHSNPFDHSAGDIVDPELSYVGESADPSRRGQFEDLESDDDELGELIEPPKKIQEVEESTTLTTPTEQMAQPTDDLQKPEHSNEANENQSGWCQRQKEEEEEEEEEEDFDWGIADVDTPKDPYLFLPSDIHRKDIHYSSCLYRYFPGQFDDADD